MFISNNHTSNLTYFTYINVFRKKNNLDNRLFIGTTLCQKHLLQKNLSYFLNYRFCATNLYSKFFFNSALIFKTFHILEKFSEGKKFRINRTFSFGVKNKERYKNIQLYQRYCFFIQTYF